MYGSGVRAISPTQARVSLVTTITPTDAPTPTKPFHERLAQPHERQVPAEITNELNAAMTFKPTLVSKRAVSVRSPRAFISFVSCWRPDYLLAFFN